MGNAHTGERALYNDDTYARDASHWSGAGSQLAFSSGDWGQTELVVVTMPG